MAGTDCCKVGRNLATYGVDVDLTASWVEEGESLRSLAATVNEAFVQAALRRSDSSPVEGEAENYHRLLTDGDVSQARRLEAERRLKELGVDPEQLTSDFVSHQSVHTHLTGCLGASRERPEPDVDSRANTVYALQNRTEVVTERTLAGLRDADAVDLQDFDVVVDIRVSCGECGRVMDVAQVFETGGCRCRTEPND